ncbi:MAG: hypothetical protein WD176_00885, partial [Pirellulales bacterium]
MSARADGFQLSAFSNRDRFMLEELEKTAAPDDATSQPYVGRWNRLVSTTNWEKGRIICEWRAELLKAGRLAADSSDEAWALRVGGVTGQHVGRLRRVYQRFGQVQATYDGLFWSHFQAALDWNDAEMWLEGALQNDWSVSSMRASRSHTLGESADPADSNHESSAEWDEGAPSDSLPDDRISGSVARVRDLSGDDEADDDEYKSHADAGASPGASRAKPAQEQKTRQNSPQPFAGMPELPEDL